MERLYRKAANAGGELIEFPEKPFRLSQFCHHYGKKPSIEARLKRTGGVRNRSSGKRNRSVMKWRKANLGLLALGFPRDRAVRLSKTDRCIARSGMLYGQRNLMHRAMKSYVILPLEPPRFIYGEVQSDGS